MRPSRFAWILAISFAIDPIGVCPRAVAQNTKSSVPAPIPPDAAAARNNEAEAELQKALGEAGNDSAAVVRNLTAYLQKFPDTPRKPGIYRALAEACQQIRDTGCELDYAERLIAIRPDDSQMMLLAVSLLEQRGDDESLTRANGYVTRVLDRVQKATPADKSPRESVAEWQKSQGQLRAALFYVRARLEKSQHSYDAASQDLQASDAADPNALSAEMQGQIAELHGDFATAIRQYARAFALPPSGPAGTVDRRTVREELGNVWRRVHGSDQGMGDSVLQEYDAISAGAANSVRAAVPNRDAHDPFAFVLRQLDGSALPLASLKGKIVVLSFWATWCDPCRELEPLFDETAKDFEGNSNVDFLAVNTDEDETLVAPFVSREKWSVPVVYAEGLDEFLKVNTLPTVVVLGRGGEIAYRATGMPPQGFPESLIAAIQAALGQTH
jgi:thiol-disulfide isomerase/thioredoxin